MATALSSAPPTKHTNTYIHTDTHTPYIFMLYPRNGLANKVRFLVSWKGDGGKKMKTMVFYYW